ncbi:hypothetical protein [Streptomyces sp. S1]|uniref:hypothetical protein n=1 Tax=Streptomyces sp. S1 TaxID=718288 RepID=UPI003D765B01
MSTVTWRIPNKRDRRLLQSFSCARELAPTGRPAPWEREVQTYFRSEALADTNGSLTHDQRFRIAEDAQGVAAAYTHARPADVHPDLILPPDCACRYLLMIAVALRHRNQGGKFADEVMIDALHDIAEREPDHDSIAIIARIDHRNAPSRNMFLRAGFEEVVPGNSVSRLSWWLLVLER